MNNILFPVMVFLSLFTSPAKAQENHQHHHNHHHHSHSMAPVSIMGDHMHGKGELMFSYRYMPMWMEDGIRGSENIDNNTIFQAYMVAPLRMQMNMHMVGIMYAPTDNFTVMAMGHYLANAMDLQTRMGGVFSGSSDGIGDISVSGLIGIVNSKSQTLHTQIGVSIPTGNIDQRGNTPMMDNAPLAYPMQLGSGTLDPLVGIAYQGQREMLSWGLQLNSTWRIGENDHGYTLGNNLKTAVWTALKTRDWLSFSVSMNHFIQGAIRGADPNLNPMMMPLLDAVNSGRQQLDVGFGSNFYVASGVFRNLRVGVEVNFPLYQNVTGVQMKNKAMATMGVSYSF